MSEEEKKDEQKSKESKEIRRVFGYNKERDLFILKCLANGYTLREILDFVATQFPTKKLESEGRISQIKEDNRELLDELTFKSEFVTKAGRLRQAMRYMRQGKDRSKKDGIDILEYIRKEQENEGNIPAIIVFERGIPVPYEEIEETEENKDEQKAQSTEQKEAI